jgi:hypothetical protein
MNSRLKAIKKRLGLNAGVKSPIIVEKTYEGYIDHTGRAWSVEELEKEENRVIIYEFG